MSVRNPKIATECPKNESRLMAYYSNLTIFYPLPPPLQNYANNTKV